MKHVIKKTIVTEEVLFDTDEMYVVGEFSVCRIYGKANTRVYQLRNRVPGASGYSIPWFIVADGREARIHGRDAYIMSPSGRVLPDCIFDHVRMSKGLAPSLMGSIEGDFVVERDDRCPQCQGNPT